MEPDIWPGHIPPGSCTRVTDHTIINQGPAEKPKFKAITQTQFLSLSPLWLIVRGD